MASESEIEHIEVTEFRPVEVKEHSITRTKQEDDEAVEISADELPITTENSANSDKIDSLSDTSESQDGSKKKNGSVPLSFELGDDVIVITAEDIEKLGSSYSRLDELRLATANKQLEEWIFVDTDQSTLKLRENLLLLSSVYSDEHPCCVVQ